MIGLTQSRKEVPRAAPKQLRVSHRYGPFGGRDARVLDREGSAPVLLQEGLDGQVQECTSGQGSTGGPSRHLRGIAAGRTGGSVMLRRAGVMSIFKGWPPTSRAAGHDLRCLHPF